MKTYDNHRYVQFSDVLDAITLFYIIKQEVREEMEGENVKFISDDDEDEDSESNSADDKDDGESGDRESDANYSSGGDKPGRRGR